MMYWLFCNSDHDVIAILLKLLHATIDQLVRKDCRLHPDALV